MIAFFSGLTLNKTVLMRQTIINETQELFNNETALSKNEDDPTAPNYSSVKSREHLETFRESGKNLYDKWLYGHTIERTGKCVLLYSSMSVEF